MQNSLDHHQKIPLVSVIIATYNAGEYIAETIESIRNQTYGNIEIIVSDDASTDNTKEIVRSFDASIKCIWNDKNRGPCAVRNKGLEIANGEYISFFDADDIMLEDKLERQINALIESGDHICVGNYQNFSENGLLKNTHFDICPLLAEQIKNKNRLLFTSLRSRLMLLDDNFSITGSTLYRKECLDQIGGFNEKLKASTDFELIYRAARTSGITIINQPVMHRRLHENNITANKSKVTKFLIISRESLLRTEKDAACRKKLKKRIAGYIASNIYLAGSQHQTISFLRNCSKFITYLPYASRKNLLLSAAGFKRLISKKRLPT